MWSVLGALAATTDLRIGTSVTCPTVRIHPAIVAQAAATTASMAPGRFFFGVGSGEALNEHVLGDRWPETDVRLDMLREAVDVMRGLWSGESVLAPRPALHRRERAHLHPARRAAAGHRLGLRAEGGASSRPRSATGTSGPRRIGSCSTRTPGPAGTGPKLALMKVCWGRTRSAPASSRTSCGRPSACPASSARSCRPPPTSSRRRNGSRSTTSPTPSAAARIRRCTWPRSASTPTPATTRSTCSRSAPDQEGFFRFWSDEVAPRI